MRYRGNVLPWYGCIIDMRMGPWNTSDPFAEDPPGDEDEDLQGRCPSIGIIFGSKADNGTFQAANVTALFCYQEIQEVQTYILFWYKDSDPNSPFKFGYTTIRSPPIINESTAVYLTNGTIGIKSFHRHIERNLEQPIWDLRTNSLDQNFTLYYSLSPLFKILLYSPNGILPEDLVGVNNRQRLQDAVNSIYNKYMVQVINSPIFRKPVNTSSGPPRQLTGSVSTTVSRLKVSFISKVVLQVFLAAMVTLGGLGFRMTDVRGTLPRDPYSVASLMALFAGSEFSRRARLTPGAEWMSVGELKELFGDHQFSLGWWKGQRQGPGGERSERFGIDFGTTAHRGFTGK